MKNKEVLINITIAKEYMKSKFIKSIMLSINIFVYESEFSKTFINPYNSIKFLKMRQHTI